MIKMARFSSRNAAHAMANGRFRYLKKRRSTFSVLFPYNKIGRRRRKTLMTHKKANIRIRHMQSNLQVFNDISDFYCEYALHELRGMARFGAFPFTRMVCIRSVESMQFLTFWSLRLNECVLSWLEKDRNLSRDTYWIFRKKQNLNNGGLLWIISSGQKPQQCLLDRSPSPVSHEVSQRSILSHLKLSRNPYWI